jgi:penicillin amidase
MGIGWRAMLGGRAWLAALAAALLALPGAAAGATLRAGTVIPPGQSDFIPATGLPTGTGSPHLKDQIPLFLDYGFKPATLGQPAAGPEEQPRPGVRMTRDAYGVPSVTGDTAGDVWFGAGYAVAQDRLFQLEIIRRATSGRLAEVLGAEYVQRDLATRRDFYTGPELDAQLFKLPPDLRARFHDYAAGVNAWIARTRSDPSKLNGEFAAVGTTPADWTARDVAAIGVYLARTVPDDGPGEYANARALQKLGIRLFDRLLPLHPPGQVTTVPRAEGAFPRDRRRTPRRERRAFARSAAYVAGLPVPEADPPFPVSASRARRPTEPAEPAGAAAGAVEARFGPGALGRGGSNMWAIRSANGGATIFNGPQLGYDIPSIFVELELHGPGLDVRGLTAPGAPVMGLGHNGHVAWAITTGASDQDDLYAEQLAGDEGYRFEGRVEPMECRTEEIDFNPPPAELIPGTTPPDLRSGTQEARLCRTRHGPVEVRQDGVAYARRYATWGRELESLLGLAAVNEAKSVEEVDRAADLLTWNENLIAIDERGNIGYWHPGLLPLRPLGFDERLPYPGTGEAEWRGFLPADRRPQVVNPRQGYLFSWNNAPSSGWTQADAGTRTILNGGFNRSAILRRLVRAAARAGGGYERTLLVDHGASSTAQGRPAAAARLRRAARGARGTAKTILDVLRGWDGDYTRTPEDGTVEPGVATWDAFKTEAIGVAIGRFGEDVRFAEGGRPAEHAFDTTNLEAFALRTLSPRGYRLAAERAFARLERRFGSSDPARWRESRQMYAPGSTGAGSWDPFPFTDRGTVEFAAELGP